MMEPMLDKPKNHKPRSPWPLILMIGVAALCFILASQDSQTVAELMAAPR